MIFFSTLTIWPYTSTWTQLFPKRKPSLSKYEIRHPSCWIFTKSWQSKSTTRNCFLKKIHLNVTSKIENKNDQRQAIKHESNTCLTSSHTFILELYHYKRASFWNLKCVAFTVCKPYYNTKNCWSFFLSWLLP